MKVIVFTIEFILVTFGLFQLVTGIYNVPSHRKIKTVINVGKSSREEISQFQKLIFDLSFTLSKYVSINSYKRKKMEQALHTLNINKSPELVYAESLVKGILVGSTSIPVFFLSPVLGGILVLLGFLIYTKEMKEPFVQVEKKRIKIEKELPRFASAIEQELKTRRDVLGILTDYHKNSGDALKEELIKTIASMRSSNYEKSLIDFETRVGSSNLSSIVRGLVAVIRGDNNTFYFELLSIRLREEEINTLKMEALKRPGKLKPYVFLILFAFIGTFFLVVGYQIYKLLPTFL